MIALDEDALICDLAETYGIFDYRQLPPRLAATLAVGLRDTSRIKMKMGGMEYDLATILAASANDKLSMLLWLNSKDASKNRNRPKPLLDEMLHGSRIRSEVKAFATGSDFDAARKRILARRKNK